MTTATDHALNEALIYVGLIERELERRDLSLDNVAIYNLEIKRRIRLALKPEMPTPEEVLSGEKSFEMSMASADYMALRRAGFDIDDEHKGKPR